MNECLNTLATDALNMSRMFFQTDLLCATRRQESTASAGGDRAHIVASNRPTYASDLIPNMSVLIRVLTERPDMFQGVA